MPVFGRTKGRAHTDTVIPLEPLMIEGAQFHFHAFCNILWINPRKRHVGKKRRADKLDPLHDGHFVMKKMDVVFLRLGAQGFDDFVVRVVIEVVVSHDKDDGPIKPRGLA